MKKLIFALWAVLCTLSCMKSEPFWGSYRSESLVERYLADVAKTLPVDHLKAMENALLYDSQKFYLDGSCDALETEGNSIWTTGETWTLKKDEVLPGVTVLKTDADSTWTLTWSGDYALSHGTFPTETEYTLRMLPSEEKALFHDWIITGNATRTENKGYTAKFSTREDGLCFEVMGVGNGWGYCNGVFAMAVLENGEVIDRAFLYFNGGSRDYTFHRGM